MKQKNAQSPDYRPEFHEEVLRKIRNKKALIGVVGLGYVGLPLCREFSAKLCPTLGFDTDP